MEIVNVYQYKKYRNDKISQGLGDFIRGCFCLLQICLNFHIPFNLSITHPLHFLLEYKFCKTSEDIPHFDVLNYPSIDPTYINQLFHLLSKEIPFDSKKFMYNTSFPIQPITQVQRDILKPYFKPNLYMSYYILSKMKKYNLQPYNYTVIHIRTGDDFIQNTMNHWNGKVQPNQSIHDELITQIENYVRILLPNERTVIISDNKTIKQHLKKLFPQIIVCDCDIKHLGGTLTISLEEVKQNMFDFYLMGTSKKTYCISNYLWGSGFSKWCCEMYSIPYQDISLQKYHEPLLEDTKHKKEHSFTLLTSIGNDWTSYEKYRKDKHIKKMIYFATGNEIEFCLYYNVKYTSKLKIVPVKDCSFHTMIEYANQNPGRYLIAKPNVYVDTQKLNVDMSLSLFTFTTHTLPYFHATPTKLSDYIRLKTNRPCYHPSYQSKIYNTLPIYTYANEYQCDAWAFQSPLQINDLYKKVFFHNSRYITKLWIDKIKEGYTFENPCLSIPSFGKTEEDNYEGTFDGVPVDQLFVEWSYL
jgi:hypothetical protein